MVEAVERATATQEWLHIFRQAQTDTLALGRSSVVTLSGLTLNRSKIAQRDRCRHCHEPITFLKHRFCPCCGTTCQEKADAQASSE